MALGLASGFLEPLESTSIHLIQEGITELVQLFPDRGFAPSDQAEYNRRMNLNYERVRDFLLLHYVAHQRDGELWRHFREMSLPDSLQEKLDAWLTRAYIIKYEFGVFLPPSWIAGTVDVVVEQLRALADLGVDRVMLQLLLHDDLLFMVNDNGVVTCVEAKTGTEVWTGRLNQTYSASPIDRWQHSRGESVSAPQAANVRSFLMEPLLVCSSLMSALTLDGGQAESVIGLCPSCEKGVKRYPKPKWV